MYKDKDKQRQAVKEAVRRHRAKGITEEKDDRVLLRDKAHVILMDTPKQHIIPEVVPADSPLIYQSDKPRVVEQSHSPIMVGYVPPKENT